MNKVRSPKNNANNKKLSEPANTGNFVLSQEKTLFLIGNKCALLIEYCGNTQRSHIYTHII